MRKLLFVVLALGTALASAAASAAPAPEWVEFTSATTPPTPFQLKRARARKQALRTHSAFSINQVRKVTFHDPLMGTMDNHA